MTTNANYETSVDGIHIEVSVSASEEDHSGQDPAVVREVVTKLSEAIEQILFELERGEAQ